MSEDTERYIAAIKAWRREMEASLRAEDGWLALVGLFWLPEGESSIGGDPACAVALPPDAAPAYVGSLLREGQRVILRAAPGAPITVNGEPATERELRSDADGTPDLLQVGRLSLSLIRRGERLGIRVRDPQSPQRRTFAGRRWFPVDPAYRVTAQFEPHSPPRSVSVENVLGDSEERANPGRLRFVLQGQELSLEAFAANDRFFIVFRDASAGAETYEAARFLYTAAPGDGPVELDFNKAYNPPCAFSSYTTCPLPLRENILPLRVAAGELLPAGGEG